MSAPGAASPDILHLDMDCFFAAVEVLEDPSLVGRPVIVGGIGVRGVVAAASYEARSYGVRSAMPMGEARRRCPHAAFISPRHGRYGEVSAALMDLLRATTPLVEPLSLDEAYLDVSGAHRLLGSSEAIARTLRDQVRAELGLACSVGVGTNKLIAKLASRAAKPPVVAPGEAPRAGRGVVVIEPEASLAFVQRHRVGAIPGVGPRTAESLARTGVETVADLAAVPLERLERRFGRSRGRALAALAMALDDRVVEPARATKSIGQEETFDVDVDDAAVLRSTLRAQADQVARRCREHGVQGRTVTVKIRYDDFSTLTRSKSESRPFLGATAIARVAEQLFDALDRQRGVRLIGVSVASLEPIAEQALQLDLFGDQGSETVRSDERRQEVDRAADEIRRRFGSNAIGALGPGARHAPKG